MKDKYGIDVNPNSPTIHVDTLYSIVDKLAEEYVFTKKQMLDMTVNEIVNEYVKWRDGNGSV